MSADGAEGSVRRRVRFWVVTATHQDDGADGGGGQYVVPERPTVTLWLHVGGALIVELGSENPSQSISNHTISNRTDNT